MNKLYGLIAVLSLGSNLALAECEWDVDDADAPDFVNRYDDCEDEAATPETRRRIPSSTTPQKMYGEPVEEASTGEIQNIMVAPLGFRQHTPGKSYEIREPYSLRRGAKFEESVTLAIHRLHLQMAKLCGEGWELERQWTEQRATAGEYYLHYAFTCAGRASSTGGK